MLCLINKLLFRLFNGLMPLDEGAAIKERRLSVFIRRRFVSEA